MAVTKYKSNPIITKNDIKPSRPDFEVAGVFNPGVIKFDREIILLLRVSERPINNSTEFYKCPIYNQETNSIEIKLLSKTSGEYDFSDSRVVYSKSQNYLTTMSHLRVARSYDGINFTISNKMDIFPENKYEAFGIEDARITKLGDIYYINYASASELGITTCLISTRDFIEFIREGVIYAPDNKDVVIFPEKIDGRYYSLHRPSTSQYGKPEIWIAESGDLLCWGNHRHLAGIRENMWDSARVGASVVPFRTDYGWVEIYHGADYQDRYCLGILLLDLNEPWKVIARSIEPIAWATEPYEKEGFLNDVIFSCGAIEESGTVKIYYGAADESVAVLEMDVSDSLNQLMEKVRNK